MPEQSGVDIRVGAPPPSGSFARLRRYVMGTTPPPSDERQRVAAARHCPNGTVVHTSLAPAAPDVASVGSAWITTEPAVPAAMSHGM